MLTDAQVAKLRGLLTWMGTDEARRQVIHDYLFGPSEAPVDARLREVREALDAA